MSMDLAKKTYSTTPDYFIAGTTVGIVTAAKEADGAVAAHNLVLLDGDYTPLVTMARGEVVYRAPGF